LRKVTKNQSDLISSFFYSAGCSLIHLVMFCVEFWIIRWPNTEKAKEMDDQFRPLVTKLISMHADSDLRINLDICADSA
jgi:hypothetical protein